jgi:hypothetical protein
MRLVPRCVFFPRKHINRPKTPDATDPAHNSARRAESSHALLTDRDASGHDMNAGDEGLNTGYNTISLTNRMLA